MSILPRATRDIICRNAVTLIFVLTVLPFLLPYQKANLSLQVKKVQTAHQPAMKSHNATYSIRAVTQITLEQSLLESNRTEYVVALKNETSSVATVSVTTLTGNETFKDNIVDSNGKAEGTQMTAPFHHNLTRTGSVHPQQLWNTDTSMKQEMVSEATTAKKPWLILHTGPSKTGTTSIQCGLQKYSQYLKEIDNYYYMGIKCDRGEWLMPNNETALRFFNLAQYMNGGRWAALDAWMNNDFIPRFNNHRLEGHNVIISSEHFVENLIEDATSSWNKVKELMRGFQIKAIMVHRHLVDWFPSYHYQRHLGGYQGREIPGLVPFLREHLQKWDLSYNYTAPSFRNNLDLRRSLDMWSRHFDDVEIMQFSSEEYNGDIFQNFLCRYVPNATRTCQKMTQDKHELARLAGENQKKSLDVVHARKSGSIQPERVFQYAILKKNVTIALDNDPSSSQTAVTKEGNTNRKELQHLRFRFLKNIEKVLQSFDILSNPDYLDCIDDATELRLKDASIRMMKAFYNKQYGKPMTEAELKRGIAKQDALFEKNKFLNKYCDVNMEALFGNETLFAALVDYIK